MVHDGAHCFSLSSEYADVPKESRNSSLDLPLFTLTRPTKSRSLGRFNKRGMQGG